MGMKNKWEIVYEGDDEEGNPTCWALEINHSLYGKYVWINKYDDRDYVVEVIPRKETNELIHCKSLASAKRWVSMNLV